MYKYCSIKNDNCVLSIRENNETYCGQETDENRIRLMKGCPREEDKKHKKRGKRTDYPRGMRLEMNHFYPYYKEPDYVRKGLVKHSQLRIVQK